VRPLTSAPRSALRALALAALAAVCSARAADVSFVRVWPGWSDATPFHRISEYFDGRENFGGRIVRRTHPDVRSGFYFLARVKNTGGLIPGATFVLQVVAGANPQPRTFTFPVDIPAGGKVCDLGLTGADWPDSKVYPIAWSLVLKAADGSTLASAQSFLWSKP
jgi:hypothetical protein